MLSVIYCPTFLSIKCSFSQFLIINKRLKTKWESLNAKKINVDYYLTEEKLLSKRCLLCGSSQRNTFTQKGKHF